MYRGWAIFKLYKTSRRRLRFFVNQTALFLEEPLQQVMFFWFQQTRLRSIKKSLNEDQPRILFGPCPIINNKYWSKALKSQGYVSDSITIDVPNINTRSDFDIHIEELFPLPPNPSVLDFTRQKLRVFEYVLMNYDIFIMAFRFTYLDGLPFQDKEAKIMKFLNKKIMMIPYGSDYYKYSRIIDQSLKHNLILNFPAEIFNEEKISDRVKYWTKNSDFVQMGTMLDDASRWDILPVSSLCVDLERWKKDKTANNADGQNGEVCVVHSPNHRGFKGSEFIIKAVEDLKKEGYKINFILLEKVSNEVVRKVLTTQADILVEQIIFTGYGLSGMEGMASGLAVMSNLENEAITQVFRRYSYLDECPILSTSPENIKENLRLLITNPELRNQLGEASRSYVEKYNSYEAIATFFEQFIDKCWYEDPKVDSMNFFHPVRKESFNNKSPKIKHPLVKNRYTEATQG